MSERTMIEFNQPSQFHSELGESPEDLLPQPGQDKLSLAERQMVPVGIGAGRGLSNTETLRKVRKVLSLIKKKVETKDFDHEKIARHDIRIGYVDGQPVERFVIHFRSNGCKWDHQTGGCTMCGFWGETAQMKKSIGAISFVNQFKNAVRLHKLERYPSLSLYNAGSFLQEEETPFSAVEEIFRIIATELRQVRHVTIESKVEYVNRDKLLALRKLLGNGVRLSVGIGLETKDDFVRNVCINKGVSRTSFEKSLEEILYAGGDPIVYLLAKPPFLTESEGIDDLESSTRYVSGLGVREIHYESMTIEQGTLVHQLCQHGYYKLPWLWSLIEVLRRVHPYAKPFISPFRYIADSLEVPHNCPVCSSRVAEALSDNYCRDFSLKHFDELTCSCQSVWLKEISAHSSVPLRVRVSQILSELEQRMV